MDVCISKIISFFSRGKEKPFMLDGPGMEYSPPWIEFTLCRCGGNPQYNFKFKVTYEDSGSFVFGECKDEESNALKLEKGVSISLETLRELQWMDLEQHSESESDEEQSSDVESIELTVTLPDGTIK